MADGQRCGCIGDYSASDRGGARALLDEAAARLKEAGCSTALGPIDGSTWRSYRLVTGGWGGRDRFPDEPWTAPEWTRDFLAAGFCPIQTYQSRLSPPLVTEPIVPERVVRRFRDKGLRLRHPDPCRMAEDLVEIKALTDKAFARQFLFSPVPQASFNASVAGLAAAGNPGAVWLAELDERLAGYVVVYPDSAGGRRRAGPGAMVLKTIAVRPGKSTAGLGRFLVAMVHGTAHSAGYAAVVHALMREGGASLNFSKRLGSECFRRYALFSRRLA